MSPSGSHQTSPLLAPLAARESTTGDSTITPGKTYLVADAARLAFIEQSASVASMPVTPPPSLEEAAFSPDEVTRRSLRAMRRAYARVVLENKSWGLPVIQWREGRGVVEVPAEQLEPLARRILEVDGDPLPPDEERALLAHLKI